MKAENKYFLYLKGHSAIVGAIALVLTFAIVLSVLLLTGSPPTPTAETSGGLNSGPLFDKVPSDFNDGSPNSSNSSSALTSSGKINLNELLGVSSSPGTVASTSSVTSSTPKVYTSNNPAYSWPQISPLTALAGKVFYQKGTIEAPTEARALKYIAVENSNNKNISFNVACHIENGKITALLPTGTDLRSVKLSFSCEGKVLYNGNAITSGAAAIDLSIPQQIAVQSSSGTENYTIYLMTLETGIPSVSVVTDKYIDILKKSDVVNCAVTIGGGDSSICYYADSTPLMADATIRGRGESSWKENNTGKKSFNFSFTTSQDVLGMGSYKEWALVSNYFDRTLIRNSVGAYLSESFGLAFTMKVRPVDLWLNGVYYGNYSIIEKIAVDNGPINIASGSSTDPEKVGFLLEADEYISQRTNEIWKSYSSHTKVNSTYKCFYFKTGLDYNIYYSIINPIPNQMSTNKAEYIYNYMVTVENALKAKNADQVSSLVDLNSLARWYLTEELMANPGSGLFTSCYMYKDVGKKLSFGPVWDFDLSTGNYTLDGVQNSTTPYLQGRRWFKELLTMPVFKAEVKKVWDENRAELAGVTSFIDNTVKMSQKSVDYNYNGKWLFSDAGRAYEPAEILKRTTYSSQIEYLKEFLKARISKMNTDISTY